MARCREILKRREYKLGARCEKLATKGELCETHYAQLQRDGERKMLADMERDRAARASAIEETKKRRSAEPRQLCDACAQEFPWGEVHECSACGLPACDECRGDRCCKTAAADDPPEIEP